MEPILIEIASNCEFIKPYRVHLKTIEESLRVALLNESKEQMQTLKHELLGLIAIINQTQFELSYPRLSKTTREDNTLSYERKIPPKKTWTIINGRKVYFDKIDVDHEEHLRSKKRVL